MTTLLQMAAVFVVALLAIWLVARVVLGPSRTTRRALRESEGKPPPPTHGQGW